ncbi:hypothetical protein PANDA_009590 [Ailuropoda melanoleuca]|uniref:Platelet-derived growth factor receptor-like protein n=1 Tax=Ailuropoda melanoleuca TaxID=9646 RepID=D2HFD3_AILME|nr:hypothetical protein PANDA_009590 [Ailuropoda melanoleuca]
MDVLQGLGLGSMDTLFLQSLPWGTISMDIYLEYFTALGHPETPCFCLSQEYPVDGMVGGVEGRRKIQSVVKAEVQERARTPKAPRKRGLKAAIPGEVKASGATGRRKPKSDLSQKSLRVKTPTEGAAPHRPAASILTQVLGRGRFQKAGLTETAVWGCPGAELLGEGESSTLASMASCSWSSPRVRTPGNTAAGQHCQDSECADGEARQGKTFILITGDQPSGEVTLRREVPPEEVPVDGIDMSFYMKKAFTVHWPWASLAGSLFCLASLGVWRQISTKYMLIHVSYPSSSPKPTVQASATSVQLGENFSVTCRSLGESEMAVDFIWEYPGQKQVGQCRSPRGQVQQEAGRTLEEARPGDSGIYTCWATNLQATGTATTRVYMTRGPHVSPAPS